MKWFCFVNNIQFGNTQFSASVVHGCHRFGQGFWSQMHWILVKIHLFGFLDFSCVWHIARCFVRLMCGKEARKALPKQHGASSLDVFLDSWKAANQNHKVWSRIIGLPRNQCIWPSRTVCFTYCSWGCEWRKKNNGGFCPITMPKGPSIGFSRDIDHYPVDLVPWQTIDVLFPLVGWLIPSDLT